MAGRVEELPFLLSFASLAVAGGGWPKLLQGSLLSLAVVSCEFLLPCCSQGT